jgi:hypothetical protein
MLDGFAIGLRLGRRLNVRLMLGHSETISGGVTGKPPADGQGDIIVQRAGMRLLFVKAELGENVQDHARFNFQFARQLVDADFAHTIDRQPDCSAAPAYKISRSFVRKIP